MARKVVTVVEKVKIMTLWREKLTTRGIVDQSGVPLEDC
jgi:hypothetical protein